ncbi:MAG: inositol-3-phosphate synthase [Deferrisomatales bacterium]
MGEIRLAVVGVGNCASALLEGIEYYRRHPEESMGLMHPEVGGYRPWDIRVVAAFDVDRRKVGHTLEEAVRARPNCTRPICPDLPPSGVTVQMGPVLDGVAPHMARYPEDRAFRVAEREPVEVARVLRDSGAEVLVSYLPVGSEEASRHYARCCLEAGVSLVNCMPAFIVSDPRWGERFRQAGIPCVGDDIKSQVGATVVHRVLARLFAERGARLERTYQLNTGGNTDFLNMLERERLASKKVSKTEAVQSALPDPLPEECIHIGPSDYVAWQEDNKVCFLRMEARGFGGAPIEIEARLSVQDSPNSGGVAVDAIRVCKVARDRGDAGPLLPISAYAMKHPPVQMTEPEARAKIEAYLAAAY